MNTDKQIVHNVKVFRQECMCNPDYTAMIPIFDSILYGIADENSNNQRSTQQPAEEADSGSC